MENKENFHFTYSAAQQQEIENIRQKYLPESEDKMTTLRRLHNSASQKAKGWAISLGIIGALILGTGMSLIMTDFGLLLGAYALIVGVGLGLIGLILVALAYPVYNRILKKERRRIAPQILQLTEELLQ